jgi:ribonuclease BN (tRNA processing enzyme)
MSNRHKRIGEWLQELALITPQQLDTALATQATDKRYLGEILIQQEAITAAIRDAVLALQKVFSSSTRLADMAIPVDTLHAIPARVAYQHRLLPLLQVADRLVIATPEMGNQALRTQLEIVTGMQVYAVPFRASDITTAIEKHYGPPRRLPAGVEWVSEDIDIEEGPLLTFVGSGDALSSGGRNSTCLHVQSQDATFLIDCGPSALVALKKLGLPTDELDGAMLTHAHGDHFAGIPFLLLEQLQVHHRKRPFWILGPAHLLEHLKQFNDMCYPGLFEKLTFPIYYLPIENDPMNVPGTGITVYPFTMEHQNSRLCLGYQVHLAEHKILAYSGDTTWNEKLLQLARDTDLFVCECSHLETITDTGIKHLAYSDILAHRERFKTKRLVLTHLGPDMLAQRNQLELETAFDGMIAEL